MGCIGRGPPGRSGATGAIRREWRGARQVDRDAGVHDRSAVRGQGKLAGGTGRPGRQATGGAGIPGAPAAGSAWQRDRDAEARPDGRAGCPASGRPAAWRPAQGKQPQGSRGAGSDGGIGRPAGGGVLPITAVPTGDGSGRTNGFIRAPGAAVVEVRRVPGRAAWAAPAGQAAERDARERLRRRAALAQAAVRRGRRWRAPVPAAGGGEPAERRREGSAIQPMAAEWDVTADDRDAPRAGSRSGLSSLLFEHGAAACGWPAGRGLQEEAASRRWRHRRRPGYRRCARLVGSAASASWGLMAKDPPQFDRDIFVDRAGVGLLFGYAQLGELVKNFVSLDLQLPEPAR